MLTQQEADDLIAMKKTFVKSVTISIPPGTDQTHELIGDDKREMFLLDLGRGAIRLSKLKFQTRARIIVVLVRLDINGSPHRNPDGTRLGGTHLHIYREGFEYKIAFPLLPWQFSNTDDICQTLEDFYRYCNIERAAPYIEFML